MKSILGFGWRGALALLATAALGMATTTMPMPGTVNYLEGKASVDGRALSPKSVGSTQLVVNDLLSTTQGHAELLLTPGVFLRIGNGSSVRMLSPGLADTTVGLESGSAMLEVDQLYKSNRLNVVVDNATTTIEKTGLYGFNVNPPAVRVVNGKAEVSQGAQHVTLKNEREVELAGAFKAVKFDKDAMQNDPLYRWSDLRSDYEAQANLNEARTVYVNGGWYGPGWYWDPYWSCYAFLPGAGMFYSPFGWEFYSPGWWGGFYGYGFGGFHGGRGFHGDRGFHAGGGFHGGGGHRG